MERLAREALVSRNASREMLRILGWQQYLDQVPRYVKVNPYARAEHAGPKRRERKTRCDRALTTFRVTRRMNQAVATTKV